MPTERKDRKEYYHQYYLTHRDRYLEYSKAQRENDPEKVNRYKRNWDHGHREYYKQYYEDHPKIKRARGMAARYIAIDKKRNRFTGNNITASWIVNNIFSGQVCHWCGESDWKKLGCDRINNSLPHTPENVVCCCKDCNDKRGTVRFEIYTIIKQPQFITIRYE